MLAIKRLPDTSLYFAHLMGGREHFGWGQDRHLLADIYDAVSTNTAATGNWKKPPTIPEWPRPKTALSEPKKRVTVKDLWARFNNK